MARARRLPRAVGRCGAHAPRARSEVGVVAGALPSRCGWRSSASGPLARVPRRCLRTARRSGRPGCGRRSVRRAVAGPEAALRVLEVDPDSRVPSARRCWRPTSCRPFVNGPRRLNLPLPATVRADERGRPLAVDGRAVDAVRESWLVEDRWWTDAAAAALLGGRHDARRSGCAVSRARPGRRLVPAALSRGRRQIRDERVWSRDGLLDRVKPCPLRPARAPPARPGVGGVVGRGRARGGGLRSGGGTCTGRIRGAAGHARDGAGDLPGRAR